MNEVYFSYAFRCIGSLMYAANPHLLASSTCQDKPYPASLNIFLASISFLFSVVSV